MANLGFREKIQESVTLLDYNEQMLGAGLQQPYCNMSSGGRKLMASTQKTHALCLRNPQVAIIGTGFEKIYGENCSSLDIADFDGQVIAKISKFSFLPNHHYWIFIADPNTKIIHVRERASYKHKGESYGYLHNNTALDNLSVGSFVNNGDVLVKSLSYDEFNDRKDGVNLETAYMALDNNMEDSVLISMSGAKKLGANLVKKVKFILNENDIPLNIYGNDQVYKIIPDIGEYINPKDGNLIVFRKERKEESLFMQSVERLKRPLMSDEKYVLHGKVVDIDIHCNNPEQIDTCYYTAQFKMYYQEAMRTNREIVTAITPYVAQGWKLEYEAEKVFANAKRYLNGDKVMEKRLFSNIEVEITVLEDLELKIGDKVSNRFGGKGVVSRILPDELMPINPTTCTRVEIIFNSLTMVNRENPGQNIETEVNYISSVICEQIKTGIFTPEESMEMILNFTEIVSPSQYKPMKEWSSKLSEEDIKYYVESVIDEGNIRISTLPITDRMDIDRLNLLYSTFPGTQPTKYMVPIRDSNGNIRYIETRRPLISGKQFIMRLKQFAEEKFSATSLSATNIRNENTKSKASRDFREMYSNTPIRAGNMEIDNMNHIGPEYVVTTLMIHSVSPHARRLVEQFYLDDPYTVDITLDQDSSNRSVEILNTYLKTMGLRLSFSRKPKKLVKAITRPALFFYQDALKPAIFFNNEPGFDFIKDMEERMKWQAKKSRQGIHFNAIHFYGDPQV